jgi:hypothetical protein
VIYPSPENYWIFTAHHFKAVMSIKITFKSTLKGLCYPRYDWRQNLYTIPSSGVV